MTERDKRPAMEQIADALGDFINYLVQIHTQNTGQTLEEAQQFMLKHLKHGEVHNDPYELYPNCELCQELHIRVTKG